MSIILFIVIGFLAGLIARALMPGTQSMGLIATTILGMIGSLLGGMLGSLFVSDGEMFAIHPSGLLLSILGSVVVLFLYVTATRRRLRA